MSIPLKPDDPAYWMLQEGRRRVVTAEAMRRGAVRSSADSARLEGREVPDGYVRPEAVQAFLDQLDGTPESAAALLTGIPVGELPGYGWVAPKLIHRPGCYICEAKRTALSERLAQLFHETYEELAPTMGYETRKASAKPWVDVPEPNRSLMIAVAAHILAAWPLW